MTTTVELFEEDLVISDAELEKAKAHEALQDLERIEEEAKHEAEATVEAADRDGFEKLAADAAATAFDFDQARKETEAFENNR